MADTRRPLRPANDKRGTWPAVLYRMRERRKARAAQAASEPDLLVQDAFTDTNGTDIESHAADVGGANWTYGTAFDGGASGYFEIQSNQLSNEGQFDTLAFWPLAAGTQVTEMSVTIANPGNESPSPVIRVDDAGANGVMLYVSANDFEFWQIVDNDWGDQIGDTMPTDPNDSGDPIDIRLVFAGEDVAVYRNDVLLDTISMGGFLSSNNNVGLWADGLCTFDDFAVSGYPA